MKTSELTGAALDWAVAKCEGFSYEGYEHNRKKWANGLHCPQHWQPSTNWAQGGPIIEREEIRLSIEDNKTWWAERRLYVNGEQAFTTSFSKGVTGTGPTPLIAAMRCYVASKLGDELKAENTALRQALEQSTEQIQPSAYLNTHQQSTEQEPVAMRMDVIVANLVREGINKHRARELAEHFIKYTQPQEAAPRKPLTQCWKCGDVDAAFQMNCTVPACGMKEENLYDLAVKANNGGQP